MNLYKKTSFQQGQIKVINDIEESIKSDKINFSTVPMSQDYENDIQVCLTVVHFPGKKLLNNIIDSIITPLKNKFPQHYYYERDNMHMTIKNIRTINNPPDFTQEDIKKAEKIFSTVLKKHKSFNVYFYRLLLFKNNLALVGTSDSELDSLILDLDGELKSQGVPDNKTYINKDHFFVNITLARFKKDYDDNFSETIDKLSNQIKFETYEINSVTLLTANAVLKNCKIINSWKLSE